MGDPRRQRRLSPRRTHGFCSPLHRSRDTATPHAEREYAPVPAGDPQRMWLVGRRPHRPHVGNASAAGAKLSRVCLCAIQHVGQSCCRGRPGRELGGRSARPPLRLLRRGRQRLLGEGSRKRVETKPRQGFAQRRRLLCLARLTSGIISPPKPHTSYIPLVSPSLHTQLSRQEPGVKLWFCLTFTFLTPCQKCCSTVQ